MASTGGLLHLRFSGLQAVELSFQCLLFVLGFGGCPSAVQVLSLPAVAQILKDVETQAEP